MYKVHICRSLYVYSFCCVSDEDAAAATVKVPTVLVLPTQPDPAVASSSRLAWWQILLTVALVFITTTIVILGGLACYSRIFRKTKKKTPKPKHGESFRRALRLQDELFSPLQLSPRFRLESIRSPSSRPHPLYLPLEEQESSESPHTPHTPQDSVPSVSAVTTVTEERGYDSSWRSPPPYEETSSRW